MIKLSRTGITTLKRQYRAVLLKCLLINAGILLAANGAMAADTWTELTTDTTQFMNDLHTAYPSWDRQDGAITGWGVDQILGMMSDVATNTDNAVAAVNDATTGLAATNTLATTTAATVNDATTGLAATKAIADQNKTDIGTINTTLGTYGDIVTHNASEFALKEGNNTYGGSNTYNGTVTMSQGLSITGGTLTTTSNATVGGTLGVTGALNGSTATFTGAVTSAGLNAGAGNITTSAALEGGTLTTTGNATIGGNATVGGTLTTTGMTTATGGLTTNNLVLGGKTLTDADTGASAITTGSATTVASTATVLTSAQNATFTPGSSTVLSGQNKIGSAINTLGTSVDTINTTLDTYGDIVTHDASEFQTALDTDQLAAVNSGITATDVAQITTNKTDITNIKTAITVAADGNYIDAGTDVAGNLGALDTQVKANADAISANTGDIADINALIGTPDGAKSGDQNSLLYGVAITGDTGVDGQKTVIGALKTVAEGAAGKAMNNVFTGTTNTFGAGENQQVIIGNTGSLTANTSLKVGTSETNMLYVSSAGTVIGAANAITGTSGALNMGGNDLTNIDDITATGKVSANSFQVDANNTFASNSLTVGNGTNAAATLSGDTMTLSHGDVVATFKAETSSGVDMLHLSVAGTNENKALLLDNDTQIAGTLAVADDVTVGEKFSITASDGSFSAADGAFVVDGSGNLTAVDGTFSGDLTVAGDTTLGGNLNVTGLSHLDGGVNVNNQMVIGTDGSIATNGGLSVNGLAALQGGINVNNKFVVAEDGTTGINAGLTVTGATLLDSTLEVNGATTLNGATTINNTLDVTGATTLGSTLAVAGDTTIGEKFSVTAEDGSFSAADGAFVVDGSGNLTTTGITHLDGGVYVGENFGVDPNGNVATKGTLYAEGVASLKGGIDVNEMFGVDAETGNVGTEGTLYVKGATTLESTLTADGESKFAKDGEGVYSLDVTTDGVTANKVITAAAGVKFGTDETPMTSVVRDAVAAKADEANNSVVASAAALQATRAAINSDVASVLGGVFAIDDTEKTVSYDNTALAGTNGFDNAAGDLTEALTNYANHVAAATGLSYDATGANVTTYARAEDVNYAGIADNTSLRDAIVQLDTNIGDAPTTTINNVAATNTINANIDAVNTALGDVQTAIENSHYGKGATDMSEMVSKVDNKLYSLDRDVRKLKKEFKAGMASVAAMSALVPNARANGNTQLSVGTGAYDGHMAAAIGGFHWFNNNVMMNVGVAYGDSSEATYRAGLTFTW